MSIKQGARVALVNMHLARPGDDLQATTKAYFHAHCIARALVDLGYQVTLYQAFSVHQRQEIAGVDVCGFPLVQAGRNRSNGLMTRLLGLEAEGPPNCDALIKYLAANPPEVLHVFGISEWVAHQQVTRWAKNVGCLVSCSDHGGVPSRHPVRRIRQKNALRWSDVFFIPSLERKEMWRGSGLFNAQQRFEVLPEISTSFALSSQELARQKTGMTGNPVVVSTSNLQHRKRPILMLDSFEHLLEQWPDAQLYLFFRFDTLLPEVKSRIANLPKLSSAVTICGSVPHDEMVAVYNSADIYFLTSTYETGPISLGEALACGAMCACTALPSIQLIAEQDQDLNGVLFSQTANAAEIAERMAPLKRYVSQATRLRQRSYFDKYLSYDVMARAMMSALGTLSNSKRV